MHEKGIASPGDPAFLFTASAYGEEAIPERYLPILEAWGATDGESLKYNALLAGTMRMSAVYRYIC